VEPKTIAIDAMETHYSMMPYDSKESNRKKILALREGAALPKYKISSDCEGNVSN